MRISAALTILLATTAVAADRGYLHPQSPHHQPDTPAKTTYHQSSPHQPAVPRQYTTQTTTLPNNKKKRLVRKLIPNDNEGRRILATHKGPHVNKKDKRAANMTERKGHKGPRNEATSPPTSPPTSSPTKHPRHTHAHKDHTHKNKHNDEYIESSVTSGNGWHTILPDPMGRDIGSGSESDGGTLPKLPRQDVLSAEEIAELAQQLQEEQEETFDEEEEGLDSTVSTTNTGVCGFCIDGITMGAEFEMGTNDGATCGEAADFASKLDMSDEIDAEECMTVQLAQTICCPKDEEDGASTIDDDGEDTSIEEPDFPVTTEASPDTTEASTEEPGTIVDIALGNPDFSTLVKAISAAGLVESFSSDGPLTVFAPTNEAFAALPEGTVETLLLPENIPQLTNILTYHVFPAEASSSSLVNGNVGALNGDPVLVTISDDGVMANDANVIIPDIMASNGIIHAIDKVLIPPEGEEEGPATTEAPITTEASTDDYDPNLGVATENVEDNTSEGEQHQTTVVTHSKSSKAAHGTKSNKAHPEEHKPTKKSSSTNASKGASKGGKEPTQPAVHKSATKTSSKTKSGKSVSSKATEGPPPKSHSKGEMSMNAKSSKSTDAKSHKQAYDSVHSKITTKSGKAKSAKSSEHHINVIDTKAQKVDGNVAYKSSKQSKKVMSM